MFFGWGLPGLTPEEIMAMFSLNSTGSVVTFAIAVAVLVGIAGFVAGLVLGAPTTTKAPHQERHHHAA
ncbi:MAG: hypothetical protein K6U14_06885 [Firmicutes bacterium]|nr:hypothetical protein [Alicyclobacillaceae bacterium]MCL6497344.1 hypothetical protein [Bacillota bacterium]